MQNWLSSIDELHEILGIGVLLLICLPALVVGGIRERLVAVITLVDAFGVLVVDVAFDRQVGLIGTEIKAVLILLAYAAMSWRWPHPWLIALTAFQTLTILLLAASWLDGSIVTSVNGLARNVVGWLMLLTLAVATVQAAQARWSGRAGRQP